MYLDRSVDSLDLPPEVIEPSPFQARRRFGHEELQELADSIRHQGMLSRIRVRPHPEKEGIYQLVYGERRLRAAQLLAWPTVPCEVAPYTDDELIEMGLAENLQREDLDPLDEAKLFRYLLDQPDKPYSIRTLAERIGKHKNYIEERLALLRLPLDVQHILAEQPKVSLRALIEISKLPTAQAREPLVRQLRLGLMSTEDIRTIVQEVLTQLKQSRSHTEREEADSLVFQRVLNKASRRMNSALTQLKAVVEVYQADPDVKKKDQLRDYIQNAMGEIKEVDEMLHGW
jgi:ParB family chromosome partitioning protein